MRSLGQAKKRPSVLANIIKKTEQNGRAHNKSANNSKSFFNRSTNAYVTDLRNKNARLARALSTQKLTCMDLFTRMNSKESKYLQQQSAIRNLQSKVKDCVSNFKKLYESFVDGLVNVTNSLASISTELEILTPEARTLFPHEIKETTTETHGPQCQSGIDEPAQGGHHEPLKKAGSPSRQCTARPMVKGQVISNPSVTLQRVSIPSSHLRDASSLQDQPNRDPSPGRLSPLLEENDESFQVALSGRKSLGSSSEFRALKMPSSCVILERIDEAQNVSLAPPDENSPKLVEIEMNSRSFGYIGFEDKVKDPGTSILSEENSSSDEENLADRLANIAKSASQVPDDDPMEGTSWHFSEFGENNSNALKKTSKKKKNTHTLKKGKEKSNRVSSNLLRQSLNINATKSYVKESGTKPPSVQTNISDGSRTVYDSDMSLTICIPSSIEMGDAHMHTASKDENHEEQSLQKGIPVVQLEKLDEIKHDYDHPTIVDSELRESESPNPCNVSNGAREMYVTHRSRKDQLYSQFQTDVSAPETPVLSHNVSPNREEKEGITKEENNENTPPKRPITSFEERSEEKPLNSSLSNLHHTTSVVLERLSSDMHEEIVGRKGKDSNNRCSAPESVRRKCQSPEYVPSSSKALRSSSTNKTESSTSSVLCSDVLCTLQPNESDDSKSATSPDLKAKKIGNQRSKAKPKSKSSGNLKRPSRDKSERSSWEAVSAPSSPTHSSHNYSSDSESSTCSESRSRSRRIKAPSSYKEPSLHKKLRRE